MPTALERGLSNNILTPGNILLIRYARTIFSLRGTIIVTTLL